MGRHGARRQAHVVADGLVAGPADDALEDLDLSRGEAAKPGGPDGRRLLRTEQHVAAISDVEAVDGPELVACQGLVVRGGLLRRQEARLPLDLREPSTHEGALGPQLASLLQRESLVVRLVRLRERREASADDPRGRLRARAGSAVEARNLAAAPEVERARHAAADLDGGAEIVA